MLLTRFLELHLSHVLYYVFSDLRVFVEEATLRQILSLQMKIQFTKLCWQVLLIFSRYSKDTPELVGAFGDASFLSYHFALELCFYLLV